MDKQIKLIITKNQEVTERVLHAQLNPTNALFEFPEYGHCQIELISDEPNAHLEVEYMNEEGMIFLPPSTPFLLSANEHQEEGYVPGSFKLRYKSDEQDIQMFFEVAPQTFSSQTLTLMTELLEQEAPGVTKNWFSRSSMEITVQQRSVLDSYHYLVNHFDEIINSLNRIMKRPIEDLDQEYQLTKVSKKPTAKSKRWSAKNANRQGTQTQKRFLEKRKFINYDVPENRAIKQMIFKISSLILQLNRQYSQHGKSLTSQLLEAEQTLEELIQRKDSLSDLFNFKKTRGGLDREISFKKDEIKNLKRKLEIHQRYVNQIQGMNGRLIAMLNEGWMANIQASFNGKISRRFLRHPSYSFIYEVYRTLTSSQSKSENLQGFPTYQTSKLFEFYNFFLMIHLLEEQGFRWVSGWQKSNRSSSYQVCTINEGDEVWFENSNQQRVRLSYDRFLKKSSDAKREGKEQLVSVNSNSRRPDLLLELFDHDQFQRGMVIEVKYRKLKSLYQEDYETDVMKQLLDYRALNYYDPQQRPALIQQAIDTVLTIYPTHFESQLVHEELYDFKFIPITPTTFSSENQGVQWIKESLIQFLTRS